MEGRNCWTKKAFVVLYVPREGEFKKPTGQQDSWKPWLENFCQKEGIVCIDPSNRMIAAKKAGHQAFAEAFIAWFKMEKEGQKTSTAFFEYSYQDGTNL